MPDRSFKSASASSLHAWWQGSHVLVYLLACAIALAGFVQPPATTVADHPGTPDVCLIDSETTVTAHGEAALLARNVDQEQTDGTGGPLQVTACVYELPRCPMRVATATFDPCHFLSECARRGMHTSGRHPPQTLQRVI